MCRRLALVLILAGCSTPGSWYLAEHWQRLDQVPGRSPDPYSQTCELIDERIHSFGPIDELEMWAERTYLCEG